MLIIFGLCFTFAAMNNQLQNLNIGSEVSIELKNSLISSDGIKICTAIEDQRQPEILSDGSGGAFIVWEDNRGSTGDDIYVQRIDSSGKALWSPNGIPICTEIKIQGSPRIISDGSGGIIIAWEDYRGGYDTMGDIYAQRIDSSGNIQWIPNGTVVISIYRDEELENICSDGSGGAIIAWTPDWHDVHAQRINFNGIKQWGPNGVEICTANGIQRSSDICSDGSGGAIIAWTDERSGEDDIYAQMVNHNGVTQWTGNGTPICVLGGWQGVPDLCPDGSGGAIISWWDNRGGTPDYLYAQRVNSVGTTQWTTNGVPIHTTSSQMGGYSLYGDNMGNAFFVWGDDRNGDIDIYVQCVNSTGARQWTINGEIVCAANNSQYASNIISDGAGGVIISWMDYRNGTHYDIYAQRVGPNGNPQWTPNGVSISKANNDQSFSVICSDGFGGAIITWDDFRSNNNYDIYAQKLNSIGEVQWYLIDNIPTSNHPGIITTLTNGSETINWILYDDVSGEEYHVLANNTYGVFYEWIGWTSWTNNTPLNVPINRTISGFYNYTIEYFDSENQFGISDTVIVKVEEPPMNGDGNGGDDVEIIPFGIHYLLITILSVISLLIIQKNRIRKMS